jgi:phosphoglycerate dehydrogenase-like enzyme
MSYNLKRYTAINTGQGTQMVEKDLIEALKAVPTRKDILYVTDIEPPVPSSEFYEMKV